MTIHSVHVRAGRPQREERLPRVPRFARRKTGEARAPGLPFRRFLAHAPKQPDAEREQQDASQPPR